MTSLYNRNYFEEEVRRLEGGRSLPLGIIVCDVDCLKLVNDTLGHHSGDELIQRAAAIIKGAFRDGDMAARIGGDEFVVILPNSNHESVCEGVERIRQMIAVDNHAHTTLPISISIGYAICTEKPLQIHSLFQNADGFMYKNKESHKLSYNKALVKIIDETLGK